MLMVYSPDINLTATEEEGALRSLNAIIESLANESLMMPAIVIDDYTLTGGKKAYTWEYALGDFNSVRPMSLKACTVAISGSAGNIDFPVSIINYDDYALIKLKTLQTNYPQYVYMDGAYPAANLLFYPVPTSAIPVTFYSYKPSSTYKDVTLNIELPPGYYRLLVALLAIDLAPSYQLQASQNIFDIAAQAKRGIMRTNFKALTMQTSPELMGSDSRYNIFSDKSGVGRG